MRLTVLGGSAAGPNPGQGCSGYLIESGATKIVLDLGPGTFPELRKHVDFRLLDAVVISHLHLDHVLDLLTMRYALAYNPVPSSRPVPLWLPPGGTVFLGRLAAALTDPGDAGYFRPFAPSEYDPGGAMRIGDIVLRFQSTSHSVPCWAMRLSDGVDGDLLYAADTGPAANFLAFAAGSRVVIAEGTESDIGASSDERRWHLTPREAGRIASDAGAEILVLTHLWTENDPFQARREAQTAFSGRVELATPGLRLEWGQSEASKSRS
jgi:ribonuclease BN (tRNA processing enzyme)